MESNRLPRFIDLPLNIDDPPYSCWGLYGEADELGTLNRLTNTVVLEAAKEIQTGVRISLDWQLDALDDLPLFGRAPFEKNVIEKAPRCVNDDTWKLNTQSSSQWDGLRHFAYQERRRFYNGVKMDDIHGKANPNVLGIHAWSKQGIVGRGILLDYHSWRIRHGISHKPFETSSIKLEDLKAVAKEQGTDIKFGDILIIRSGFTVALDSLSRQEKVELAARKPPGLCGVEQGEEMLEWIWKHFSAVAGDQPSFECWPTQWKFAMHEILLSGWGCPIGELFDLESLAEHCQNVNRWSFFMTSKPCNVPGGVASPPNILAIF